MAGRLRRNGDDLSLSVEHRAAPSPMPMTIELAQRGDALALEVVDRRDPVTPASSSLDEPDFAAMNNTFAVKGLPEARIEPEIILHLASAPRPGMSEGELLGCIDWIAHGFEIVHSIFPGWTFTAADAVAAYGAARRQARGNRRSARTVG